MLQRARVKTFQPETIKSACHACGLIPFNRNCILRDPVLQAKMILQTPLATWRPGLRQSAERITGASELDLIEMSNQQIPETPANKPLKHLLSKCINQARILDAAKIITEEEVDKERQLAKPANADKRQLCCGLILSSKHLAKLYHNCMQLDKKKAEAATKYKATKVKALTKRKTGTKNRKFKRPWLDSEEAPIESFSKSQYSESSSDEELVDVPQFVKASRFLAKYSL